MPGGRGIGNPVVFTQSLAAIGFGIVELFRVCAEKKCKEREQLKKDAKDKQQGEKR